MEQQLGMTNESKRYFLLTRHIITSYIITMITNIKNHLSL